MLEQELVPDGLSSETLTAREEEVATSTQHVLCDEKLMHCTTNENVEIIDKENDEMESTEKNPPSRKAFFKAVNLIESFALFQNDDLAKQLRFNDIIALSLREKQSTINTFFKPI